MCANVVACSNDSPQHIWLGPQPTSMKYAPQCKHSQAKYPTSMCMQHGPILLGLSSLQIPITRHPR